LKRIRALDLSLGTLGDQGADALLSSPDVRKLARLDLHHHYLSDAMIARIAALDIEVDLEDQLQGEEDDRFVSVSE
jgi:hypothetical protein